MTVALRQSPPANVLDGEEMKRLEEAAIVLGLPSTPGQAGPEHPKRVRPIVLVHLCRHWLRPLIRSEAYESRLIQPRNPKNVTVENSSTQPNPLHASEAATQVYLVQMTPDETD